MAKRIQYSVEYPVKCSSSVLYNLFASSSGLSEWFADKVDVKDSLYYFSWDGSEDVAEILRDDENECIRYRWEWMPENEFFEFKIEMSDITNEILLKITDYADADDVQNQMKLWESQVEVLKHRVGS